MLQGKDLFDASLFRQPKTAQVFYTFMGELSELCRKAKITKTHSFIGFLEKRGTLLRWYTQNIDGLEARVLDIKETNIYASVDCVHVKSEEDLKENTNKNNTH